MFAVSSAQLVAVNYKLQKRRLYNLSWFLILTYTYTYTVSPDFFLLFFLQNAGLIETMGHKFKKKKQKQFIKYLFSHEVVMRPSQDVSFRSLFLFMRGSVAVINMLINQSGSHLLLISQSNYLFLSPTSCWDNSWHKDD